MKKFEIPPFYKGKIITKIKEAKRLGDPRKKDFTPAVLDFGPVKFLIPRHFGFCYGVENAIEIAYKTINENHGKRIFLLSEMIHNPDVNQDLKNKGVKFIMNTSGNQLINWDELKSEDVVIIPAFGTTLEIEKKLNEIGINPYKYNTTCPFVEKVWHRSEQLGKDKYTVIIHGKHYHEETRATFSHTIKNSPSVIVKNLEETKILGSVILNEDENMFLDFFKGRYYEKFNFKNDLKRIGVVNQTTMLATETQAIAEHLKNIMIKKYGIENLNQHFADTRDTLCYATYDNQEATNKVLEENADLAIVVGGYNSSNTSHIVELCEERFPTYFISSADKIIDKNLVEHFDIHNKEEQSSNNFIPEKEFVNIILTSGASCPDSVVEEIMFKILSLFKNVNPIDEVINQQILA
jgi:4-hydroxy-3-methylbut-2-en-1-yl diphosphate reductase